MRPILFVDGEQGTTGLRVMARLRSRDDIELITLAPAHRKDPHRRAQAINRSDITLLCLPDAAAREALTLVENPGVRILDASSAHRTAPGWVYGLPELSPGQAAAIGSARRVSNPGCFPTGALTLLRPLIDDGLLPADARLTIHAVSGYSGRGREGVQAHEGPDAANAPALQVYGLGLDHKHTPEIQQLAGLTHAPVFVPAYGHYRQGIVLTIGLHRDALAGGATPGRLMQCLRDRYAGSGRVRVVEPTPTLDPTVLNDTDGLNLSVHSDPRGERIVLSAVFDNLGKGAAGAAVQNLSLMLGTAVVTASAVPA